MWVAAVVGALLALLGGWLVWLYKYDYPAAPWAVLGVSLIGMVGRAMPGPQYVPVLLGMICMAMNVLFWLRMPLTQDAPRWVHGMFVVGVVTYMLAAGVSLLGVDSTLLMQFAGYSVLGALTVCILRHTLD